MIYFKVGNIWYLAFVFGLVYGICIWSCIWHLYLVLCLAFVFGLVFGICIWSCIWSILWAAHERRGVVVGACYADIADHQVRGKSGGVQSKGEGKSGAKQRGGKG